MTYEQQALLYLVRLGIGNDTELGFDFTGVDWRSLVDSSFSQAVPAIAVDGLQKLYESNPSLELALDKPELEALKYEWFGAGGDVPGLSIPVGQWHGINVLEPTVILECKDGKYEPLGPEDMIAL